MPRAAAMAAAGVAFQGPPAVSYEALSATGSASAHRFECHWLCQCP